jgi:CRISPR system Cascade subunit CasB
LGQVLAEAGYSEARLEQILASDGDVRIKLFTSMVRFLAAKAEGFNWTDAARLLLTNDEDKREAIHRRIASDFYRTLSKPKEK